MPDLVDLIVPVYNEGNRILRMLNALACQVRTPIRVLICYDFDIDTTLGAIKQHGSSGLDIVFVKNKTCGPHSAVMTGFQKSQSDVVLVMPADDDYNASIIDKMIEKGRQGVDIVCASRFIHGGSMIGCPWLKAFLVRTAAFTLHHFAGVPTRDPTNGFRLFSRRLLTHVHIESSEGFTYSIELLAKCHRLGWPIVDIPAKWIERRSGASRFKVVLWIPAYLRWYFYIFTTPFLRIFQPWFVPKRKTSSS